MDDSSFEYLSGDIALRDSFYENDEGYDENCTVFNSNYTTYYDQLGADAYKYGSVITEIDYKRIYSTFENVFIDTDLSIVYNNYFNSRYYANVQVSFPNITYNNSNVNALKRAFHSARAAFYGDNPLFFGGWEDTISVNVSGGKITSATMQVFLHNHVDDNNNLIYSSPQAIEDRKNESIAIAEEIIDDLNAQNYDKQYDKLKYIMQRVCNDTVYSPTDTYSNEMDGALIDGKTKCLGYARTFQYLSQQAGFICITASGGSHAWNFVKVDGEWFFCDATDADIRANAYGYEYDYDRFLTERPSHIRYNRFKELGSNSTPDSVQYFGYPTISNCKYRILGDANCDGSITDDDKDLVFAKALNSSVPFTERQFINSDVDKDGVITTSDVAYILQKILDPSFEFPSVGNYAMSSYIQICETESVVELTERINKVLKSYNLPEVEYDTVYSAIEKGCFYEEF